jgi:hypothetical protein
MSSEKTLSLGALARLAGAGGAAWLGAHFTGNSNLGVALGTLAAGYLTNRANLIESEAQQKILGSRDHHLQLALAGAFRIALDQLQPRHPDHKHLFDSWQALLDAALDQPAALLPVVIPARYDPLLDAANPHIDRSGALAEAESLLSFWRGYQRAFERTGTYPAVPTLDLPGLPADLHQAFEKELLPEFQDAFARLLNQSEYASRAFERRHLQELVATQRKHTEILERLNADLNKDDTSVIRQGQTKIQQTLDELQSRINGPASDFLFSHSELDAASSSDFLQGLPSRWAVLIEGFLIHYLGTEHEPAPFGGREDNLKALDEWLADESAPRYGVIVVHGGLGKSALLAHWVQSLRQHPEGHALIYFPISARWETNSSSAFFQSLAWRLSALYSEAAPRTEDETQLRDVIQTYLSRESGRRILIVVDGLDEAVWRPGINLFPPSTRKNIRVLVAARPTGDGHQDWLTRLGWQARRIARAFPLGRLDRSGIADVLKEMGNPLAPLAGKLNVVDTLFRLSQGDPFMVRLYVDRLREEADRPDLFDADQLHAIQPGLRSFFALWLQDQALLWGENRHEREPRVRAFLALCSLARGRLTNDDIQGLAPQCFGDRASVETTAADLGRFVEGEGRHAGYIIFHPRLGDFLRDEELTEQERLNYSQAFLEYGALATREFAEGEGRTISDYFVRWYGAHIEESGADADSFRTLLTNRWYQERRRVDGTPAGFLEDLDRAWRVAASGVHVGLRIRAALLRSSVLTHGSEIGFDLFALTVRAGVISLALGEVIARQQESPEDLSRYLLLVSAESDGDNRTRLLQAALAAALTIRDEETRAIALSAVARELGPSEREFALHQALSAATAIEAEDEPGRARALSAVAAQAGPGDRGLLRQALAAASTIEDVYHRILVLSAVATNLPPKERKSVLRQELAAAMEMENDDDCNRAEALIMLAAQLPHRDRKRALHLALTEGLATEEEYCRSRVLIAVAGQLAPTEGELLRPALAAALAITGDASSRARALSAMAPKLSPADRDSALQHALSAALTIEYEAPRADALSAVAAQLNLNDRELLRRVLAAGWAIRNKYNRAEVLSTVGARLGLSERRSVAEQALGAHSIGDEFDQASVLSALAAHLRPVERETALQQALNAALAIAEEPRRAYAVKRVVAHLEPGEQDLLRQALAAALALEMDYHGATTLSAVAANLPSDERDAVLQNALSAALTIDDDRSRAHALSEVAAKLAPGVRESVLREALTAALAVDELNRGYALTEVAEQLGPEDQVVLKEVLAAAHSVKDESKRALALSAVARHMDDPEARELTLRQALAAAVHVSFEEDRARALISVLVQLAPGKREPVLRQALAAARSIPWQSARASVLSSMAAQLKTTALVRMAKEFLLIVPSVEADRNSEADGFLKALSSRWTEFCKLSSQSPTTELGRWLDILSRRKRERLFSGIAALAPAILLTGSVAAVSETVQAIVDVAEWWP